MTLKMNNEEKPPQDKLEAELKDVVQDLYELMVQTAAYDQVGHQIRSQDVLISTLTRLHQSLTTVSTTATSLLPESDPTLHNNPEAPSRDILIPPELLHYVDGGRNPDIYTREFVELARRGNQIMKGKKEAFGGFRDILAREIGQGCPELREDVNRVLKGGGVGEMKWEEDVKMEQV